MSIAIRYKGIYHDRLDAPFVGSLISAIGCHHDCPGCFHDNLKDGDYLVSTAEEIIKEIEDYKFSEGIILGGLEWTEQYDELLELLHCATISGLKVILYTHYDDEELRVKFPEIYRYKGIYIKYGEYQRGNHTPGYSSYGVPLASDNQYIEQI